jgi:hypothetical protein
MNENASADYRGAGRAATGSIGGFNYLIFCDDI